MYITMIIIGAILAFTIESENPLPNVVGVLMMILAIWKLGLLKQEDNG